MIAQYTRVGPVSVFHCIDGYTKKQIPGTYLVKWPTGKRRALTVQCAAVDAETGEIVGRFY